MRPSFFWLPLLLAVVTFAVYWPSLKSDFVYDARLEILEEGFVTSLSNLPAVLSLKVLGMNLTLGDRPGQMLYLMLLAAVCGKDPFGYHLASILLHAANVALLFILLRRLIATKIASLTKDGALKVQLALATVTLIFALHPVAVESVAEISFSSSLLVTFFTLLSLLAATAFRPENSRNAMLMGGMGTFFAFASVTCKESGIATAALLIVYWFFFRRRETKRPWFLFLGAATAVTMAFLAARFLLAPASPQHPGYLGGSFGQVFLIQPRFWVFMMGKLIWPTHLSGDYTIENINGIPTAFAFVVLVIVVAVQIWLMRKSNLGALGVATYWLGLSTVSNFVPLFRILADRFYYLPLAGVAMQLLALFLLTLRSTQRFWLALAPCLIALVPFTVLTLTREEVFANNFAFWSDVIEASPFSSLGHSGLGNSLSEIGRVDEAIAQFQKAIDIDPDYSDAYNNLGTALLKKGQVDEAITKYRKSMELRPTYTEAHNNLGLALLQNKQLDEAAAEFKKALEINPNYDEAHDNLGVVLFQKGQVEQAMAEFRKAIEITPNHVKAHNNLGFAYFQKGQTDDAISEFRKALAVAPNFIDTHSTLGVALYQKGRYEEAKAEFEKVLQLKPDDPDAKNNLAKVNEVLQQKGAHP